MSPSRQVIDFPSPNQNDGNLKLFAILFYLMVAFMLIFVSHLSEGGLGILTLLGILYNYGIRHRIHKTGYFQKNRLLVTVLLVLILLLYPFAVLTTVLVIGAYWLLVGRTNREAPYFLKFHILTALVFNFFLLMPYLILDALISLAGRCLVLFHMLAPAKVVADLSGQHLPLLMMGLLTGAALWLAASVVMGKTPYIGVITDNVRQLS